MRRRLLYFAIAALLHRRVFVPKLYNATMRQAIVQSGNAAHAATRGEQARAGRAAIRSRAASRPTATFQTDAATVDGRRVDFMVDTGASDDRVARARCRPSRHSSRRSRGLHRNTGCRHRERQGEGGARTELSCGASRSAASAVRDVAALVLPDERARPESCSACRFSAKVRWEQKNGKLILEQ